MCKNVAASTAAAFMLRMLQNFPKHFQWLAIAIGNSV
jgi:hypothetical protein